MYFGVCSEPCSSCFGQSRGSYVIVETRWNAWMDWITFWRSVKDRRQPNLETFHSPRFSVQQTILNCGVWKIFGKKWFIFTWKQQNFSYSWSYGQFRTMSVHCDLFLLLLPSSSTKVQTSTKQEKENLSYAAHVCDAYTPPLYCIWLNNYMCNFLIVIRNMYVCINKYKHVRANVSCITN